MNIVFIFQAFATLVLMNLVPCSLSQNQTTDPNTCLQNIRHRRLVAWSQRKSNRSMANIYRLLPNLLKYEGNPTAEHLWIRNYIRDEMQNIGWSVELDTFEGRTTEGRTWFSNIIATFNTSAPRRVLMACHYHSLLGSGNNQFVGAIDSGVPCALMIDTAKRLDHMMRGRSRNFTFQFIFFDGGDAAGSNVTYSRLYASYHLTHRWSTQADPNEPLHENYGQHIERFIMLGAIGAVDTMFSDHPINRHHEYRILTAIEQCLQAKSLLASPRPHMFFQNVTLRSHIDDHIPFFERYVSIVDLIATPYPSVWNTTNDNIANLDRNTIDNFSRILRVYVASMLQFW